MPWTKLADATDLQPGTLIEVEHGELQYALCNVGGDVRALGGTCPHQGGPLGEGALNDGLITCPWHMWEFDSATGECVFNRAITIPLYPARIEGGEVQVDIA